MLMAQKMRSGKCFHKLSFNTYDPKNMFMTKIRNLEDTINIFYLVKINICFHFRRSVFTHLF